MSDESDILKETVAAFEQELPSAVVEIMQKAQRGEIDQGQIMEALAQWISQNTEEASVLTSRAMDIFDSGDPRLSLEDIWEDRTEEGLNPRMNPMYEAALAERLQFDGDIPELRSGPMTEGVRPAVPVKTDAKSPVAIGMMLETASDEVQEEIKALREPWAEEQQKRLGASQETSTDLVKAPEKGLKPLGSPPQPKGYRAGQKAEHRTVAKPSGKNLLGLSQYQKQEMAWKVFSTTHGRRTAAHVIGFDIVKGLADIVILSLREATPKKSVFEREWVSYLSEEGATNPEFSFIEVATQALITNLREEIEKLENTTSLYLEMIAISRISDREVGWKARIVRD